MSTLRKPKQIFPPKVDLPERDWLKAITGLALTPARNDKRIFNVRKNETTETKMQ